MRSAVYSIVAPDGGYMLYYGVLHATIQVSTAPATCCVLSIPATYLPTACAADVLLADTMTLCIYMHH